MLECLKHDRYDSRGRRAGYGRYARRHRELQVLTTRTNTTHLDVVRAVRHSAGTCRTSTSSRSNRSASRSDATPSGVSARSARRARRTSTTGAGRRSVFPRRPSRGVSSMSRMPASRQRSSVRVEIVAPRSRRDECPAAALGDELRDRRVGRSGFEQLDERSPGREAGDPRAVGVVQRNLGRARGRRDRTRRSRRGRAPRCRCARSSRCRACGCRRIFHGIKL